MTTISVEVVLSSRNVADPDFDRRLSTILCRYPRFIHSELMTHRAFSRNAASSRAIPVDKMIQSLLDDPAIPMFWTGNQPGMQGTPDYNEPIILPVAEYYDSRSDEVESSFYPASREDVWGWAMAQAIDAARAMTKAGYHKQVVNRLLEPFMHITVLISSTEWDNFFELRIHEAAEPHIRLLAEKVKTALKTAPVQVLQPDEWHLPFVTAEDRVQADFLESKAVYNGKRWSPTSYKADVLRKLSTARCASTSYKTVEGFDMDLERAVAIHEKLVGSVPIHASPAEHLAMADHYGVEGWVAAYQHRNFVGFCQYRSMVERDRAKAWRQS